MSSFVQLTLCVGNPSHRWIFQTKCQLWGKSFYGWCSTWPEYWKITVMRQDYLGNSIDNEKKYCQVHVQYITRHTQTRSQMYFEHSAHYELEQLERLRSEDTPRRLMITHTIESYWIPCQKMTKSKLQILKIRQNFKFLNFETGITRDTPSEVAW